MATDIKQRVIDLINDLNIEEAERQDLLKQVNENGVDKVLLERIRILVDEAIADFEDEADKEIQKIKDDLNKTLAETEDEFAEIEKLAKAEAKAKAQEQDAQKLDDIRKKLANG